MRKATAGRLVKFVTSVSLNKIKLKVQLRCQDKGQASEIIFHSQTLNYPVRLDQIQSKGGGKEETESGGRGEREREKTSRNICRSCYPASGQGPLRSFFKGCCHGDGAGLQAGGWVWPLTISCNKKDALPPCCPRLRPDGVIFHLNYHIFLLTGLPHPSLVPLHPGFHQS